MSVYDGYLNFAGNETINNARVRGYASSAPCPMHWLKGAQCLTLWDALGNLNPYRWSDISQAPWYDFDLPEVSGKFYGAFGVDLGGLGSVTRSATVIESIDDGGTFGGARRTTRQVRVRYLLLAQGLEALEYGRSWFSASLDTDRCSQHGSGCGTSDLTYFADCPPARTPGETTLAYGLRVDDKRRYLHGVGVVSGPLELSVVESNGFYLGEYEVTFTATRPHIFGQTKLAVLPTTPSQVVQDIPFNLIKSPSAELPGTALVVVRNYAPNPSVETDATGWAAFTQIVTGTDPAPYVAAARSTDIAAVGLASFRTRLLGNGTTVVTNSRSRILAYLGVPFAVSARASYSVWVAALVLAGASGSILHSMRVTANWYNGATFISETVIGTSTILAEFNGRVYSLRSQVVPVGATICYVQAACEVTWSSSATPANNSDIRMYMDAVALTVP